jgi:cysteine desulfurase
MLQIPLYFDNLATTPVDPRVLEVMLPYFTEHFGNAASTTHAFGWKAREAVERARTQVAALLGARLPREIVFTSGATEADNLAIKGVAAFYRNKGNHIITCATEHKAVLDCCKRLEVQGCEVTYLPVDEHGLVDLVALEAAITQRTVLISLMAANNEIGTVQPLERIGALAKERGVLWHCDGAQAVGKMALDVEALGIDLLSVSGHKLYGPKGIGVLYVRSRQPRVRLEALLEGGGHERGLRSGTLNVPGIVGLGEACELYRVERQGEQERLARLRQRLYEGIVARLDGVWQNGHPQRHLPGCLHLSFAQVDGTALILALQDIALSSGSACTSGDDKLSHVLQAIGMDDERAAASLRFGLGRFHTEEEVDYVANRVVSEVERLRQVRGEALVEAVEQSSVNPVDVETHL